MLGNIELNVDTTNNHLALTSYFADDVSIVTTASAIMFKPARRESGTYHLVTVIPVHISIIWLV